MPLHPQKAFTMQLSWFLKPIYRFVHVATILALSVCGWFIWFASSGWLLFFIIAFSAAFILIGASFIVCSGVYVTSICKGDRQYNKIAITFDDGPGEQTREILQVLDKYKVKATFFLIGRKAALQRAIVQEMAQKHHTIGNHSFDHKIWFPLIGTNRIKNDLTETQRTIASITGAKPVYFRPPFGVTNPFIAKALKNLNLKTIGWSVRSLDTVKNNPEKILNRITRKIEPGSIVLMHDASENAALVLEQLLIYCLEKKLAPVNLDELLQ